MFSVFCFVAFLVTNSVAHMRLLLPPDRTLDTSGTGIGNELKPAPGQSLTDAWQQQITSPDACGGFRNGDNGFPGKPNVFWNGMSWNMIVYKVTVAHDHFPGLRIVLWDNDPLKGAVGTTTSVTCENVLEDCIL